jgi:hypothetical protein
MNELKDFVVLILTHGRPSNVITKKTLRKQGYTGRIVLVIDNEDKTANEYFETHGKDVVMFNKKEWANKCDEGNNFDERRTITHARNASFEIARELGYTYFIQLDDDYQFFEWRFIRGMNKVKKIDYVFALMLSFYKSVPNILSFAMAQGGDFIGGTGSKTFRKATLMRKCMNSFICSVERPFKFIGAMNEDVNTYTTLGGRGKLFFTLPLVSLTQKATQSQKGGITDMYLKYGTYAKAFTSVMMNPSSVKVAMMGDTNMRLHHQITWKNTVPLIIREKWRKIK